MTHEEFIILPFSPDLRDEILKIEAECFSCRILEQSFDDYILKEYFHGFCIMSSNKVCGYICYNMLYDFAEIIDIAVDKDWRNKHFGSALIEHMLAHCRKNQIQNVVLEVRSKNTNAIKLYKKYGFIKNRTINNYYQNPPDHALCMCLNLII